MKEAVEASDWPAPGVHIPSATLFKRFPEFVFELTQEAGPGWYDDCCWRTHMAHAMGSLHRVAQLEAEGKNPEVRIGYRGRE